MLRKNLSFIFLIQLFLPILISPQDNGSFKERIKKAVSFEDLFFKKEQIIISQPKIAFIEHINEIIPLEDNLVLRISGKGIYKILLYNRKGEFINPIAEAGYDQQDYLAPSSITADERGNVLVYDNPKSRINIYTQDNKYIETIILPKPGEKIILNSKGEIFLNTYSSRSSNNDFIIKHNSKGEKICEFASLDTALYKSNIGLYRNYFCLDKHDFVYEVNMCWGHIRKYNSAGMMITEFGDKNIVMATVEDYYGKIFESPRFVVNFFIIRDFIFVVYDNHKVDVFDTEGESVKKDVPINSRIVYVSDKEIFTASDKGPEPIIFRYVPRE